MKNSSDKIDLLTRVSHYHENVAHLESAFSGIIKAIAANERARAQELYLIVFQQSFVDHFRFEEQVVFPAFLAWKNTAVNRSLIDEYLRTHGKMLVDGRRIAAGLSDDEEKPLSKEEATDLISAITMLYRNILEHAADEDRTLVPLISDNPTLRFLTSRNLALFKTKAGKV